MFDKTVTAVEPFAFTLIIAAGASLAGWVSFTNSSIIGVSAVFAGSLLVVNHVVKQLTNKTTIK